ncbi:hypothetical protein Emag_003656 [Eimeria magna]
MGGGTRWYQAPLLVACLVHFSSSTRLCTALAGPVALKDSMDLSVDSASAYDLSSATSEDELSVIPSSSSFLQEQKTSEGDSAKSPKKKKSWLSKVKLGSRKRKGSTSSDASAIQQGGVPSASDLPSGATEGDGGSTKKKAGKFSLTGIFSKKTKSTDKQASRDSGESSSQADSDSDSERRPRGGSRKETKPRKRSKLAFFKRSKKNAEESDEEQSGEVSEGTSGGTSKGKKKGVLRRIFSKKGSPKGRHSRNSNEPLLSRSPKLLADITADEASAIPLLVGLPRAKQPLLPSEHPSGCMPVQVTKGLEEFVELLPALGVGCRPQQETTN